MNIEQFNESQLLTIHCDGRVTVGDKLKPEETAKLVLDIIKTQWLKDAQAKMIRELQDWKESALAVESEWNANAIAKMLGGKPGESQRKVIQREVPRLLDRIKRLEEESESRWNLAESAIASCDETASRIKRLEEAGDAVAAIIGPPGSALWADENEVDAAWNNWRKAKEDKQ